MELIRELVINMPKHVIQIGKLVIESKREIPWDDIIEIAKIIKKFAKWNPDEKKWVLNWRLISNVKLVDILVSRIKTVDPDYGLTIEKEIRNLLDNIPRFIIDEDKIAILPLNADPYELLDKLSKRKIRVTIKYRDISLERYGEISIPYLYFPIDVFRAEKDIIMQQLPNEMQNIIKSIDLGKIVRRIRVYPISSKKIIVDLGDMHNELLERDLIKLGEIRIFLEDSTGVLKERIYHLYRRIVRNNRVKIILPSYAIGLIENILRKYGLETEITYGLVLKRLESINPQINLMEHQKEALESWISAGNRGTIVIPTGGGKTHVALAAIAELRIPTIILVPNKWLLTQWRDRISSFLGVPKGMIGILGGGEKKLRDITISTYQSAYKYVEEIVDKFPLAVFDEAHHVPARTFKNIALYLRAIYRMALSATPKRRDRNEILLFKLVGDIVYQIGFRELVEKGVLAPLAVRKIYVSLSSSALIEYRRIERLMHHSKTEFEKRKYLNKLIEIARDNPAKIEVIREIVEKHKDEKIFIFAGSIKFAELIEKELKPIVPTALLTSKTSKAKEDRIIKSFQNGVIRCLVLVKKGEEGVDVGDASVAIIAGGSKQERELIQRVGRILRGRKNKLAWLYEIVTKNTVDEMLSRARNIKKLVLEIGDIVERKYGVSAFEIKYYPP